MIGAARYFNPRYWAARFFPKLGEAPDPSVIPVTGAISASGVEAYIGGTVTASRIGGTVTSETVGGSVS